MKEHKNNLILIPMTYKEAYDFCGDFGANFILLSKDKKRNMQLNRLYQDKENPGVLLTTDQRWGGIVTVAKGKYEIYWIGGTR